MKEALPSNPPQDAHSAGLKALVEYVVAVDASAQEITTQVAAFENALAN